ncbi:MAG: hypothetical protein LZF60_380161 [Nitrospira sp.]|nr:MAG: hypothetical protein LZF60_380161 [Nitrospira sp.]
MGSVVFEESDFQRGLSYFLRRNPNWRRRENGISEDRESVAKRQQERSGCFEAVLSSDPRETVTLAVVPPRRTSLRPPLRKQEHATVTVKEQIQPRRKTQPEVRHPREKEIGEDQPWYELV